MSQHTYGFVGRVKEGKVLEALLDALHTGGHSSVLVVRGDAGIGKTALLHNLVDAASGCRVVHVTGVESEFELPYAALHQLCGPMLDLAEALPAPQRDALAIAFGLVSGRSPDRLMIGLAALTLLSEVCEPQPLLCVVDDAQWLDRESALTFGFVGRRLFAERVGLVLATREAVPELAGLPELVIHGLDEGDARTLLDSVLHVPLDERVRDRVISETRGNPLALLEWTRGLTSAQLAGGFGSPSMMTISAQIEERFRRRLDALPPLTRQLLTVAAADPTGDPIIVWRAASALGVEPSDAAPAMDDGLIEIDVRVRFHHPVARSAAYNAAGLAERQAVHRQLAAATDPTRDPDRWAWHRALGSPGPDEDIAAALERSADRARARGGLSAAAALLEQSVTLSADPARRGSRILAAAAAHLDAGALDAAAGLLAAAELAPLDEAGRIELDIVRARHANAGGDLRSAPTLLVNAATRVEPVDGSAAFETYLRAMGAAVLTGDFARDVDLDDVARRVLVCPRQSKPTIMELLAVGLARCAVESPAAATPVLRQALDAAAADEHDCPFYAFGFVAASASLLWDRDALERASDLLVTVTRSIGALTMLPWALNAAALLRTLEGDLTTAASMMAEANEIVNATGGNLGLEWSQAILAAYRADDHAVVSMEHLAERGRRAGDALAVKHALWGRSILHNGKEQHAEALTAGSEAMLHAGDWGTHLFFSEHVEAAVRSQRPTLGAATLERLRDTTEPSGSDWGIGIRCRAEALLAPDARAEDLYREAVERLGRTRLGPELARSYLLYGEWLRRTGRVAEARDQLRTAFEMYSAMGVGGFADRARRALLQAGEKAPRPTHGSSEALSTQEAHIARLAADGRTNAEIGAQIFVSPRTVEWHLRKVFSKLGVTSRRALSDALQGEGPLAG